jgi:hypothetical protein
MFATFYVMFFFRANSANSLTVSVGTTSIANVIIIILTLVLTPFKENLQY